MWKVVFFATMLALSLAEDCPELDCPEDLIVSCQHGLKTDVTGCSICECESVECKGVSCDEHPGTVCRRFNLTSSNTKITNCVDPNLPEICQFPKDSGRCRSINANYYYHQELEDCELFNYGGCDGNANRFSGYKECLEKCNPNRFEEKYRCSDIQCEMECPSGFVEDDRGCDLCKCQEPEPVIAPKQQMSGEDEGDCDPIGCFMECEFGFRKDGDGCIICECLSEGECNEEICPHHCKFGYRKDNHGCTTCRCRENPCHFVSCEEGKSCKVENNSAVCEPHPPTPVRFGCPKFMCAMHCENGFQYDQFGCEECSCLEEPPKPCPKIGCDTPCPFGNIYTTDGCSTCQCLEDPCETQKCDRMHVCEHQRDDNCPFCRVLGLCIEFQEVQRVHIQLELFHEPVDEIDLQQLEHELLVKLTEITQMPAANLLGVRASRTNDVTVVLEFHIIESDNLVKVYEHFQEKVSFSEGPVVTVAETEFMPQHSTLQADFSSRTELPTVGENKEQEEGGLDDATKYIVIGCVVGGVALLMATVIVVALVRRTKRPKTPEKKKNVIYKPAASSEEQA